MRSTQHAVSGPLVLPECQRTVRIARRAAPGFTMVELAVALGVIGVVLVGIVGVFITSYTNVDHGGRVTRAATYAHQKAEELRNTPFGVLATIPTTSDAPETAFTRTWAVTVSGAPPARIAGVQVDVRFLSQTGRPAAVLVQSQIAE